ncbi:unnamed protein product, partial [Rotaria sp. Silwood2]
MGLTATNRKTWTVSIGQNMDEV